MTLRDLRDMLHNIFIIFLGKRSKNSFFFFLITTLKLKQDKIDKSTLCRLLQSARHLQSTIYTCE